MAWHLEEESGPYEAPWDGKDAVGWVWEVYEGETSRRVVVEVSGTAMAVADQYLPEETVQARATKGRSEVEKVLHLDEPPRRITLGTTGYLGAPPEIASRPDFVVTDEDGQAVAVVEVKNPEVLTLPLAVVVRDQLARTEPGALSRFFLIVSQNRAVLFTHPRDAYDPLADFSMFEVVQAYYPPATRHQRFRGSELTLLVQQWLNDLARGEAPAEREAERALGGAGFVDAVRGGLIQVQFE